MAFGIGRAELNEWKKAVSRGEIAFLTHYWRDSRYPDMRTVTKVGCSDRDKLADWCARNGFNPAYIHDRPGYPHYDLIGPYQARVLAAEGLDGHIVRFGLDEAAGSRSSGRKRESSLPETASSNQFSG